MTTTPDLDLELDRSSPVPLYYQVARQLESAIESGRLSPGARLDNEIALAGRLGLSRPTMRRAIQELVDKGLLVRKRGVGTQVVHQQVSRRVELSSLYDDLERSGQRPSTRVLSLELVGAPAEVARAMRIEEGDPVVRMSRLRLAGGSPLAVLNNWLPAELSDLDTEDLEGASLYQLMRRRGIHLRIAQQRIGARGAEPAEARLLGVPRGAALLTMQRTTYDEGGRCVEWADNVYVAGAYSFEVTVVDR